MLTSITFIASAITSERRDSLRLRLSAGGLAWFAYASFFLSFHDTGGDALAAAVVAPVIVAASLGGVRWGIGAGLLSVPFNIALFGLAPGADALAPVTGGVLVASLTGLPIGGAVGGFSSIANRYRKLQADRERQRNELQESEALYRSLIENMGDAVTILSDGERKLVNQRFVELFGFSNREEALASPLGVRSSPNARAKVEAYVAGVESGRPPVRFDNQLTMPTGEVKHVEAVYVTVSYGGRPAMLGVIRDVTDRQRAEAALRESEELYRALVENLDVGVTVTVGHQRVFANDAFANVFGLSSKEEALRTPLGAQAPLARRRRLSAMVRKIEAGKSTKEETEVVIVTPSGEKRTVATSAVPVIFKGQRGVLAVTRNVTEQRTAEKALRENEERYRVVVEQMADAVTITSGSKRLFVNQAWLNVSKTATREEALAMPVPLAQDEPAKGEGQAFLHRVETADHDGAVFSLDSTPMGDYVMHTSAVRVTWEGRPAVLAVHHDVTERDRIERLKSEFISVVSHEVRTPLTSLSGSLDLLDEGLVDAGSPEGATLVSIAARNARRLWRLVDDILNVDRLESGLVSLDIMPVELTPVVTLAVEEMEALASERRVHIEVSHAAFSVLADATRIVEVLTNLLSNAIKYSPAGATVRISASEPGDGTVAVSVSDEGPGIPRDQRQVVFDRFHRVDGADNRDQGGSGLGLAICKALVEQHGGKIWVESSPDKGSTFRFTLPAAGD